MKRSTKISLILLISTIIIVAVLAYIFRDNANINKPVKENDLYKTNVEVNSIHNINFDNAKFNIYEYKIMSYNKTIHNMNYNIIIYQTNLQVINLTKDSLEIELLKKQLK
jgi:hypothetical protein